VQTLRAASQSTQSLKTLNLISEALRRVTFGLNSNSSVVVSDLLVFIHRLIEQSTSDSPAVAADGVDLTSPWALSNKWSHDKKTGALASAGAGSSSSLAATAAEAHEAKLRRKPTKDESAALPAAKPYALDLLFCFFPFHSWSLFSVVCSGVNRKCRSRCTATL
jgi:hypothetical protein